MIGIVPVIVSAFVLEKDNFDNEIPRSGSKWKEYLKGEILIVEGILVMMG